ncbi:MAG: type III-B CRISPR-associated protein Cas10/Cmr2 [Polyangiaceae bacterium]|nr:type III-B CRISPR-associated protein Cas10/Cmr2 [Polyangiaceae bacterium]
MPIANIALAQWIAAAKERFSPEMARVADLCRDERFSRVERPDLRCGNRLFAFDAEVFLEDRWRPMLAEASGEPKDSASRQRLSAKARAWRRDGPIRTMLDRMNRPHPYVACLVADGDRMGDALNGMHEIDKHRAFSAQLSHFAERARKIVEQQHKGVLVYAGGDDVLAFINVVEAWACAEALRRAFEEVVQGALSGTRLGGRTPTLSVGIGIGHLLESLGHLRRLGGEAEKLAKTRRNALGVVLDKRSGRTTPLLEGWEEDPVTRLSDATRLLRARGPSGKLSVSKVHEIDHAWSRMPPRGALLPGEQPAWAELLRREVHRILARSGEGEGITPAKAGLSFHPEMDYDAHHDEVRRWVSRMLVAKLAAEATDAATAREGR